MVIKNVKGTVMVNESKVAKKDIVASNGVIHVIDTVLMPVPASTTETASR